MEFSRPGSYGKKLDWKGYSVHDAANILRRYLLLLPEPIVPLDFYFKFRDPFIEEKHYDLPTKVYICQELIKALPPLNRQLLLYILDLLAVFAAKCEENLMTAGNLAAIFQPALLSHPIHSMHPEEYLLSQMAIVFLIENQDHFLFGMSGTGIDDATWKEIHASQSPEAGPLPPQPTQATPSSPPVQPVQAAANISSKAHPINTTTGAPYVSPPISRNQSKKSSINIRRSASTTSTGTESARKRDVILRRNQSVASHHRSATRSPPQQAMSPEMGAAANPPKRSGSLKLGFPRRSNTVPSKRKGKEGTTSPYLSNNATPPVPPIPPLGNLPQGAVAGGTSPGRSMLPHNEVVQPPTRSGTTSTVATATGPGNASQPQTAHNKDQEAISGNKQESANSGATAGVSTPARVTSPPPQRQQQSPQSPQSPKLANQIASPPVSPRVSMADPPSQFAGRRSAQQIRPISPERPGTPPQETSKFSSILHALSPPRFSENRQSRKERRAPNRLRKLQSPGPLQPSASVSAGGHAPMPSVGESRKEESQELLSPNSFTAPSSTPPRDVPPKEADMAVDGSSYGEGYHSSRSDDASKGSASRPSSHSHRNDGSGEKLSSSFGSVFQRRSKK